MLFSHGQLRRQRAALRIVDDAIEHSAKPHSSVLLEIGQRPFDEPPAGRNREGVWAQLPHLGR